MKKLLLFVFLITASILLTTVLVSTSDVLAAPAQDKNNLCFNGSFESTNHPLDGWTYDYAWLGNSNYMNNKSKVSYVKEGGRGTVAKVSGGGERKFDSPPVAFEKGYRYYASVDLKGGAGLRIYFIGYMWKPGVRPYARPHLGHLRNIYRSNPYVGGAGGEKWKTVKLQIPLGNDQLSELAWSNLRHVRFITLYIFSQGGTLYVDNCKITRKKESVKPLKKKDSPKSTKKSSLRK